MGGIFDKIPISTITTSPEPGITIYTFDPKVATLSIKHDAGANTLEFKGYGLALRHMILTKTPLLDRIHWQEKKSTLAKPKSHISHPANPPIEENKFTREKRPRKPPNPIQPKATFNYDTPPTPKNTDTHYRNMHTFHPAITCFAIMSNRNQSPTPPQTERKPTQTSCL